MTAIRFPRGVASPRRGARWLPLAVTLPLVLVACGDPKDVALCTRFEEFLAIRAETQAIREDPSALKADEAVELGDRYVAAVRGLKASSDDRYGQELDNLEQAVRAVVLTLSSVRDDADFDTWGPLIEDDIHLAENAATAVVDVIEPSCPTVTPGT